MTTSKEITQIHAIGGSSFLGSSLATEWAAHPVNGYELIWHDWRTVSPESLGPADIVLNFSLHPSLRSAPYDIDLDLDLKIAKMIPDNCQFVMMSSRKVYDPSVMMGAREDSATGPSDVYGTNKLESEMRISDLLGDRFVCFRIANIIGYELHAPRASFMRMLSRTLVTENRVILDVSKECKRDFLPVEVFGRVISQLIVQLPTGITNIGSGFATKLGDIAKWVIEGFGRGEIVVTRDEVRDEFVLDISKLRNCLGQPCSQDEIRTWCLELGIRLANESI